MDRFGVNREVRAASPEVRASGTLAVRGASHVVRFVIANLMIANLFIGNLLIGNLRAQDVVLDRMVAVVNGDVVTQSDVRAARRLRLLPSAAAMDDEMLVTQLIERRLILAEVARYAPPEPTLEQIAARQRSWAASLAAGADHAKLLESAGFRDADLTRWLRDDLRIVAYLDQRFTAAAQPTREQALAYFREHEADFAVAGTTPEFAAVEAEVRRRVAADRRATRIREWIDSLKQRAEIRLIAK